MKCPFYSNRPQRQLHVKQTHTSWSESTPWDIEQKTTVTSKRLGAEIMHGVTVYWGPHSNLVKQGGLCKIPGSGQQKSSSSTEGPRPSEELPPQQNAGYQIILDLLSASPFHKHIMNVCSSHPETSLLILTCFVFSTPTSPHSKSLALKPYSDPISSTLELRFLSP